MFPCLVAFGGYYPSDPFSNTSSDEQTVTRTEWYCPNCSDWYRTYTPQSDGRICPGCAQTISGEVETREVEVSVDDE